MIGLTLLATQLLKEFGQQGLRVSVIVRIRLQVLPRGELNHAGHLFGDEGGVVSAADFRRVAHQGGYLVEALLSLPKTSSISYYRE